jgi:hypothetical protein
MLELEDEIQGNMGSPVCGLSPMRSRPTVSATVPEGIFDQPRDERPRSHRRRCMAGRSAQGHTVRSANQLLDVIKERGRPDEDGAVRVPHDPNGPEYAEPVPFEDGPVPNFTAVNEPCPFATR